MGDRMSFDGEPGNAVEGGLRLGLQNPESLAVPPAVRVRPVEREAVASVLEILSQSRRLGDGSTDHESPKPEPRQPEIVQAGFGGAVEGFAGVDLVLSQSGPNMARPQ